MTPSDIMRLDEILSYVVVIVAVIVALFIVKNNRKKPPRMLTRLVAANIGLDAFAIAIWGVFPATQWTIYRLDFLVVGIESIIAVAVFAVTLFGLVKGQKWAPVLAIIMTVTQRVFATYVFFPSIGIALTVIWSLMILFFAYLVIKSSSQP